MLTAAHCCYFSTHVPLKIVAGDHNRTVDEGTEQIANVTKKILHPKYHNDPPGIPVWDACILKLDKELEMNQYVQPVALPEPDEEFLGHANVSGWGSLREVGLGSSVLLVVEVTVYSMQECSADFPSYFQEISMICAASRSKGPCYADAGGPMVCGGKLCGIISWGQGFGREGLPGVFTNVAKIREFIDENI